MALTSVNRVAVITRRGRRSSSPATPASDARQRAFRCAPAGFERARAYAAQFVPSDFAPAAELPACMND